MGIPMKWQLWRAPTIGTIRRLMSLQLIIYSGEAPFA